jgi:hypothetical protein
VIRRLGALLFVVGLASLFVAEGLLTREIVVKYGFGAVAMIGGTFMMLMKAKKG